MYRRLNVSLPEKTLRLLNSATKVGNRSRLVDLAIRHYLKTVGAARFRILLEEGYRRHAKRDRSVAAEWSSLDAEA
jgi:CopG family transcriptional regulator / antitoxin EndoAI